MRTALRLLTISAGLVAITTVATLTIPGSAEGQPPRPPAPVTVVNTPAEPVPVVQQGASSIEGVVSVLGAVTATQAGPWTVGVDNLPAVQNVNLVNDPVRVVTTAPALVQGNGVYLLRGSGDTMSLLVPAGAVLTDLLVQASDENTGRCRVSLSTSADPTDGFRRLYSFSLQAGTQQTINLRSGLPSSGTFHIHVRSLDLAGRCDGSVLWTGYEA